MEESKNRHPSILERLANGDHLISDGATGTYLQMYEKEPGFCPEELNVSRPELISNMASDYFRSGSDLVLTNSFGANVFMLTKYGYGNRVREFNLLAAQHARSVAPTDKYVVGSVGPTGEFIHPLGEISESEMMAAFVEQVTALEEGGADAVVIETMTSLEEAKLAIKAAKEHTDLIIMATMTFDLGPRGFFTMMGVTPEEAAKELPKAGADIVGSNCGNGIEAMIEVAKKMREATDKYTLIHSNAGIPTIKKGQIIYPETPEWMASKFRQLDKIGINVFGGCCGTTPQHIKTLSETMRTSI